jgi:hypothetical protein
MSQKKNTHFKCVFFFLPLRHVQKMVQLTFFSDKKKLTFYTVFFFPPFFFIIYLKVSNKKKVMAVSLFKKYYLAYTAVVSIYVKYASSLLYNQYYGKGTSIIYAQKS